MGQMGKKVGAAIRAARVNAGLTQADLARAVAREQSTVAKWEGGRADTMQLVHLPVIEEACGVRRGWLLERAGYVKPASTPEELIASDERVPARLANSLLDVYRFVVTAGSARPVPPVELEDPDELEIWRLSSLPEEERIKLIAQLRAMRAERPARASIMEPAPDRVVNLTRHEE